MNPAQQNTFAVEMINNGFTFRSNDESDFMEIFQNVKKSMYKGRGWYWQGHVDELQPPVGPFEDAEDAWEDARMWDDRMPEYDILEIDTEIANWQ